MHVSVFQNLVLHPGKMEVFPGSSPNNVHIQFKDARYTSIIIDTKDLLYFLESLTEQVRLIDLKQDPKDL
jgi:hypothetical protein